MKAFKQTLRQPLKWIAGVIVVSLAVSILSVCLGQSIVAKNTQEQIQHHFTTIALPTTKYNYEIVYVIGSNGIRFPIEKVTKTLPEDVTEWIHSTLEARSDLVQTFAVSGLASAYVAELTPENMTDHLYYPDYVGTPESLIPHHMEAEASYACAMLEIILDEVGEPNILIREGQLEDGTKVSIVREVTVELKGTVKSAVSLQEGYSDPRGQTVRVTLTMPSTESLETLNLAIGERYLVYGDDYMDGNWHLCGYLSELLNCQLKYPIVLTELDDDAFVYYSEREQEAYKNLNPNAPAPIARYYYRSNNPEEPNEIFTILDEQVMKNYNSVLLTVKDETLFGRLNFIKYSDGSGTYPVMNWDRFITDENGNEAQITQEEYSDLYSVPTIAHLTGSVEEFLASEEGSLWAQKLEHMQVNYQAFPIIGVEKMGYIADFARETARIVEGRDFTAEELASGAKVCILSESLAVANGLAVGDTISPRFYNYDYNDPYQGFLADGNGVVNPSAYSFTANTPWAGDAEEYVIIGLYRQDNAWGDVSENLYSFTPNTIFAPKSSISSDMDYGSQGLFQTLVLQNGAIEEFRAVVEEAGYPDLFVFYDQEYTTISDSLENYREVAQRAMLVGVAVYAVILLLFLLFYPGSQGKALATMTALGAQRKYKFAHVFTSGAGILVPGTVIGFALGALLWQEMINMIAGTVDATVTLEMDMGVFLQIALFQLLVALALTALIALPMTLTKGLSKRK